MTVLIAAALALAWVAVAVPAALAIGAMVAARDRQVPTGTRTRAPVRVGSPALGGDRPSR